MLTTVFLRLLLDSSSFNCEASKKSQIWKFRVYGFICSEVSFGSTDLAPILSVIRLQFWSIDTEAFESRIIRHLAQEICCGETKTAAHSAFNIGQGSAYANELLIQQVLARNAMHPAVCSTSPEKLKQSKMLDHANIKFMSDSAHENARRFSSYDDFEDIQLHSTIIIDKAGQVRWNRTGGDPFTNIDFMLGELKRIN